MFNFGGKSKIKPIKATVRTITVPTEKKPPPRPSAIQAQKRHSDTRSPASARNSPSTARSSPATTSGDDSRLKVPKHKGHSRPRSPAEQRIRWGEDDSEEEGNGSTDYEGPSRKKQKLARPVDSKRQLQQEKAYSKKGGRVFDMIHAADIPIGKKKSKIAEQVAENLTVEFQYPSSSQRERYALIIRKDEINPPEEFLEIAKIVTEVYLTPEQAEEFNEPNQGIIRQLEKTKNIWLRDARNAESLEKFKLAVDKYNKSLSRLIDGGAITNNLGARHDLPLHMVLRILQQVYDRAVSPYVDTLKQYENGTDNVYGELLGKFISEALINTGLKSDQVFVDLGSGVGNVVLQAALQFGCESWGCEMMDNACDLAESQEKEFNARCRLWGIKPGDVHLERGDFLENQAIQEAMKRADVILVNNQAFTPDLNHKLIQLFLDLKDGCKIVSLRSFVPDGHEISDRNLYDPVNLLEVKKLEYFSGSVSWTDIGGDYFLATKDEKRVKKWMDQE
ncbi:related to Histone-lysine N-methyltransferase, H3 lysine-79 specific [Phialocephala subalpina]|uniref:Histone-lysine N-methyltransferase, H3 lysine-79 specific n=1 Tax=Phialocephala subalpina TaxID=576137 RepID=A0A1L7WX74_9HELO|nr:related to Histone-lysine N-methyltransferase, H3 lysine-79 specific [Phialocephala subalpina]